MGHALYFTITTPGYLLLNIWHPINRRMELIGHVGNVRRDVFSTKIVCNGLFGLGGDTKTNLIVLSKKTITLLLHRQKEKFQKEKFIMARKVVDASKIFFHIHHSQ